MIVLHPIGAGFGRPDLRTVAARTAIRLKRASRRAHVGRWRPLSWSLERMMERYMSSALAGARWVNPNGRAEQPSCCSAR